MTMEELMDVQKQIDQQILLLNALKSNAEIKEMLMANIKEKFGITHA